MNEDELGTLFQKHRRSMVRIMRTKYQTLDEETLDVLYTDVWERIHAHKAIIRLSGFRAYLSTCFDNIIKNYIRDNALSPIVSDRGYISVDTGDYESFAALPDYPDTRPEEAEHNEAIHERVEAVLSGMPRTLVLVGTWYHVDGETQESIAKKLGGIHQQRVSDMIKRFDKLFRERYKYLINAESRGEV